MKGTWGDSCKERAGRPFCTQSLQLSLLMCLHGLLYMVSRVNPRVSDADLGVGARLVAVLGFG